MTYNVLLFIYLYKHLASTELKKCTEKPIIFIEIISIASYETNE